MYTKTTTHNTYTHTHTHTHNAPAQAAWQRPGVVVAPSRVPLALDSALALLTQDHLIHTAVYARVGKVTRRGPLLS